MYFTSTRLCLRLVVLCLGMLFLNAMASPLLSAEEPLSPAEWLQRFERSWREQDWVATTRPPRYLRIAEDKGWQTRMLALQGLVAAGKASIPQLLDTLEQAEPPQRIFAVQALGYLAADVPTEALLKAVREDKTAAVRLYAVDALGMQGGPGLEIDWKALRESEKNKDVRKHIGYVQQRKGAPVAAQVIEKLINWDPRTIDSAVVGKPAPDFHLQSATGERVSLQDYRGKQAVVLIFVYGDT